MIPRHLISALFLLALSPDSSGAQSSLAYSDRGNRLEGHRRTEVSSPALEPLSFSRGEPLANLSSPAILEASFYLHQASPVYINARELVAVKFYQMTPKQIDWPAGANTFGPWQTSDVIDRLGIRLANIGVLARVGSDRVGAGGEITALSYSPESARSNTYEFVFRVKYDVKKASYHVEHIASGSREASRVITQVTGGAPVSFQFDLTEAPEGQYRLFLDCLYSGRKGGPQRTFEFYHQP